jgi:hypothetical protein
MGTGVEREINARVSFDSKTLPPSFSVCCLSQRAIDCFGNAAVVEINWFNGRLVR